MNSPNEQPEEYKLANRDLRQAAITMLNVGASMDYAMTMFRLHLQREALERTKDTRGRDNRSRAAEMLSVHRNTFTRNLPFVDRKCAERYADRRPPVKIQRGARVRQSLLGFRVTG
jgi:hypothetical protein